MSNNFLLKLWFKVFDKSKYQDIKYKNKLKDKVKYQVNYIDKNIA